MCSDLMVFLLMRRWSSSEIYSSTLQLVGTLLLLLLLYNYCTFLLCTVMPAGRFLGNDEGDDSEGAEEEGGGAAEVSNVEMEFSVRNYIERFVQ